MPARERLRQLFLERSFRLGEFILASGRRSDFYIDCRTTTMHAEGLLLLGEVGMDAVAELGLEPDVVGGLTMGADPIACAVAAESFRRGRPIHAFSVRKTPKRHGTGKRIEGCFESGARVLVVEDVITTGGSALQACEAVEEEGGTVLAILAAVDREEGGREAIEEAGYSVTSLFGVAELRARLAGSADR
ncbi:MAG: orotate phosphoribosyltransferase [Gemmatimonadota bacterium]|nr:orotate phosphoribosyltransferase [Gemmatimonadota bacterium]